MKLFPEYSNEDIQTLCQVGLLLELTLIGVALFVAYRKYDPQLTAALGATTQAANSLTATPSAIGGLIGSITGTKTT